MSNPKFVVVGAGSIFFTRAVAVGMCKDPRFQGGTLSLVDVNEEMLDVMSRLCRRIIEETGADLKLEATTDRKVGFCDADFVVLSFSRRGVDLREIDTVIPAKYGVRQSSGDSIGPGGLFRSIRTVPAVLEMARDIEAICPNAWVFNYVNPSTVMGMALSRYTKLKTLAICDGVVLPETLLRLLDRVKVPREAFDDVTRFRTTRDTVDDDHTGVRSGRVLAGLDLDDAPMDEQHRFHRWRAWRDVGDEQQDREKECEPDDERSGISPEPGKGFDPRIRIRHIDMVGGWEGAISAEGRLPCLPGYR
jgi:hypothetical protein